MGLFLFDSCLNAVRFWFWARIDGWKRSNGKWRRMEWQSARHLPPFSSISGRSPGRIDSEPRNFGSGVSRSIEWCARRINRQMNEPNILIWTARPTLIGSFMTRPLLREFAAERFIGSTRTQKTFDRTHLQLSFSKRTNSIRKLEVRKFKIKADPFRTLRIQMTTLSKIKIATKLSTWSDRTQKTFHRPHSRLSTETKITKIHQQV